jgi:hypothetical protein
LSVLFEEKGADDAEAKTPKEAVEQDVVVIKNKIMIKLNTTLFTFRRPERDFFSLGSYLA